MSRLKAKSSGTYHVAFSPRRGCNERRANDVELPSLESKHRRGFKPRRCCSISRKNDNLPVKTVSTPSFFHGNALYEYQKGRSSTLETALLYSGCAAGYSASSSSTVIVAPSSTAEVSVRQRAAQPTFDVPVQWLDLRHMGMFAGVQHLVAVPGAEVVERQRVAAAMKHGAAVAFQAAIAFVNGIAPTERR